MTLADMMALFWIGTGVVGLVAAWLEILDSHRTKSSAEELLKGAALSIPEKTELEYSLEVGKTHRTRSIILFVIMAGSIAAAAVAFWFPPSNAQRTEFVRGILTLNQTLLVVILVCQRMLRRRLAI